MKFACQATFQDTGRRVSTCACSETLHFILCLFSWGLQNAFRFQYHFSGIFTVLLLAPLLSTSFSYPHWQRPYPPCQLILLGAVDIQPLCPIWWCHTKGENVWITSAYQIQAKIKWHWGEWGQRGGGQETTVAKAIDCIQTLKRGKGGSPPQLSTICWF